MTHTALQHMTLPGRLLLVYFFEALHTRGFDSLEDAMVHTQTASHQHPLKYTNKTKFS